MDGIKEPHRYIGPPGSDEGARDRERDIGQPRYDDIVTWRNQLVGPFQPVYVGRDDLILVSAWAPVTAGTVNLSIRYMTADGRINPQFTAIAVTSGALPLATVFPGSEGWIISLSVETPGAMRGQIFVTVELQRGQGTGDSTKGQVLYSGYPGSVSRSGYPQAPLQSPMDGRGWMSTLIPTVPGAGADWFAVVPAGELWLIKAVRARLVTSAAVANRFPHLKIEDSLSNVTIDVVPQGAQTASTTLVYDYYPGASPSNIDNTVNLALPTEVRIPAGYAIISSTTGLQAADQWGIITMLIERFVLG